jgi:glyoxylase I family protein
MAIARFSHVGLCVSDLTRSLHFYRELLGFREVGRIDVSGEPAELQLGLQDVDLQAVLLERDGTRIELLHYLSPGHRGTGEPRPMNALGLTHLSLRVEDLGATLEELEKAEVRILRTTRVTNDPLKSDAIFVTDPDGTRIELLELRDDPDTGVPFE